jgi:hypothetical protein
MSDLDKNLTEDIDGEDIDEDDRREYVERLTPLKVILAIIALVAIVGAIIGVAVVMYWPKGGNPAEKALAKASLEHVINAAEKFRGDNDDVYEGLTAAKIKGSLTETVVDGMPKANQVGIMDYNSDQLVLVFQGQSGQAYKATINAGIVTWGF